jgi:hypothetical protein
LLAEVAIERGELDAATTAARANVEALALLDRFLSSSSTPEANNTSWNGDLWVEATDA